MGDVYTINVGQWFDRTYYATEAEEIAGWHLNSGVPGLNYYYDESLGDYGGLRIYGTPTQAGTFSLDIDYFIVPDDDFWYTNLTVYVIQPSYTHTIAYNANGGSGSMGNTTVTDTNSGNTNVTFASNGFTAPTGHYFAGWRINNTGTVYQPGNTYAVGGNGSVTAYAYWLPNSYTVSATVSPANSGTVSGTGTYTYGSTATLVATPATHYHFRMWSNGSTSTTRTVTVTGHTSMTAYFELDTYTVSLTAGTGGTVSGGGTYSYGSTASISATPNSGYRFVQWSDGNTSASRSLTVTGNVTLSASFELEPTIATTNVKVNGTWTTGSVYVKVNGSWVESKKIYVKVNGEWVEGS